jgi:hypothetical protein
MEELNNRYENSIKALTDLVSPRSVLRSALQAGVLLQPELDLLNEAIVQRIPIYAKTMHDIIRRMSL